MKLFQKQTTSMRYYMYDSKTTRSYQGHRFIHSYIYLLIPFYELQIQLFGIGFLCTMSIAVTSRENVT